MTGVRFPSAFRVFVNCCAMVCVLQSSFVLAEAKFQDPLETPALARKELQKRPLMAIAAAGNRLIAVGSRGLVIASDDQGKSWTQAQVPVQSDLLAVNFPTAMDGWIAGHDGVILHSADGGRTWTKQLDGRQAAASFKAFYGSLGADGAGPLAQIEQNYKAGPALPFLDVWFEDANKGFAVGSFGMLVATSDGGKTWEPWLHRISNPQYLNLNALRGIGNDLYIVGEHGQIYQLNRSSGHFDATDSGYVGSLFGIAGNGSALVAFGLRGTAYRKGVGKSNRWEALTTPNEQTLAAGIVSRPGGAFVLVNAAGEFVVLDGSGKNARLVKPKQPAMRLTGIAALNATSFVVTGLDGVRVETVGDAESPMPAR